VLLQATLAAAVAGRVAWLAYRLGFVAPLDLAPLRPIVMRAAEAGDHTTLERLARGGGEAWLARVVRAFVDPTSEGVEGALLELRFEAASGVGSLRVLGRLATSVGLLGALAAVLWLRFGDHGLDGLAAGLPEAEARGRAVSALAWGFATATLASGAATVMAHRARRLLRDARSLADALTEVELLAGAPVDPARGAVLESPGSVATPLSSELPAASAVSPERARAAEEAPGPVDPMHPLPR